MIGLLPVLAIFAGSMALSYVMQKRAMKKAKKAADDMAGVLVNKESNIEPIPVIYGERRVGGVRVFVSTKDVSGGDKNEFLYIALAMAEGEVESITNIHIDDEPITNTKFSGLVTINTHTGSDNQTYDSLLTEANAGWTSNHRLRGVAYLAIRLKWDEDVFSGIPEITGLVKGRKLYDPRTPSAAAAYSNNPALCIRDYLTNARYGKGLPSSAINDTLFGSAATDCDESVIFYQGASGGKLFECNAVIQTDEELFGNLEKLLMGCRGFLPYSQGLYGLSIDKSGTSVFAFNTDNMIGGISIKGEQKEDKFNRVIAKFANPDVDYQPDEATWPDPGSSEETSFLAQDNGTLLVEELDLHTITNYYAARDMARVILLRSRNSLRTSFRATSEALQLSVADIVTVQHPTPGWTTPKPFQVENIQLNYDGTCDVALIEYDPSIYTYDLSAPQTSYPDTDLPDPNSVTPPTSLVTSASTSVALDGTIVTSVEVSWTASLDSFVSQYDVQWSTDNTNFESVVTDNVIFTVSPAIAGATYYFKVRAINSLGVKSSFVSANQGSAGDDIAPALPTSLSATAGYKSISLEWTNPADKDFSNVEVYRSTSSDGTFSLVASIGGGWGAATEFLNGGLADATAFFYKFKSVDYSGNKSDFTAEVTATTNAAAINGSDGTSTFTAPIFRRSATTLSAPTGGTFNFGTNTLTAPTDWYTAVPSGTDPIYQATFQFSVSGDTGTVTAGTWSTPVIIAENGTDGDPGGDGLSTFVFPVYQRASSVPTAPSGGSYNFSTNAITAPTGWSSSIPSGTDPIYASTTQAQVTGPTGTDSSLTWTTPIIFVQNGTDGDPGGDGQSTFTAPIFRRASTAPSAPTGGTFNFGTNTLTPPTDWSITVPTGTDPIYQANFQFSITGDTGTVTAGTWSDPVVIAANGTDGDPGANGLSTFTLSVHQRASSAPSTPTGGSYNFTSNTVTAPSGWTEGVPSGTDPVYVSTTKAQISGATGTDSSLTWSAPVILAQNGIDGDPGDPGATGPRNADGYLYYSVSQASAPDSPSATSYSFVTGSFGGLTDDWSTTPPTNTGGDAKYWATYWHVTEATFDGTQTRTFNTPFNSVQFNGLVTFTNLDLELDNASSTKITTINGGLLKTGTIEGDRIRIDGVGIDVVTDGAQKTLQIGDSGVTTVKIDALAVTEGKIANLAVDTLKIADNAVYSVEMFDTTVNVSLPTVFSSNTNTIYSTSWNTVNEFIFDFTNAKSGQTVLFMKNKASITVYDGNPPNDPTNQRVQYQSRLLRGTTVVWTGDVTQINNPMGVFNSGDSDEYEINSMSAGAITPDFLFDVPDAGNLTYKLQSRIVMSTGYNGASVTQTAKAAVITGGKT
jgi:hypothetical protein